MDSRPIFHIASRSAWYDAVRRGEYRADNTTDSGCIECLASAEVAAGLACAGESIDPVLLCIEPSLVAPELFLREKVPGEAGLRICGALRLAAVRQVLSLEEGEPSVETLPERVDQSALNTIWIRAVKMDGSRHWEHPALLASNEPGLVTTRTRAGQQINKDNGPFTSVFNTEGHYWPDRWLNVIRLESPAGELAGFYCNVAMPPRLTREEVRYIDLQLDVRVSLQDGALKWQVLDEDEFETARLRFGYSDEVVERCRQAVDEIISMVEKEEFPFVRV